MANEAGNLAPHCMNRLALFPATAKIENDTLTIGGQNLSALAGEFGTPLYFYDRAEMDRAVAEYRTALSAYPASADVTYAGKAYLCTAIAQWTQEQNLWLDCTGEGELSIACASRVTRERVLVHGVNKSDADLRAALEQAGVIVVDHLGELSHLAEFFPEYKSNFPGLWLRFQPGLAVETHHAHTQTGQYTSKFGMTAEEILEAAKLCQRLSLPLEGIHFHQGSNFRDPAPLKLAIERALDLVKRIGFDGRWHFSPGGGWGTAYHESELPNPPIESYVKTVIESTVHGCAQRGLSLPHLHLEPGRSLIARAGVAIYRVGAIKRRGSIIWLLTDGGLADNPRHALYGARYSALPVTGFGREMNERVSVAGPYCESGDVILEDLPFPEIKVGELIAVPVSGAYQLSMASNYNGARRPAVIWLDERGARLIQRRETFDDLKTRDLSL